MGSTSLHLNGLPVDLDKLKNIAQKFNLRIIEDCARACGCYYKDRRVGSTDIGAFSFGYGKTFYAYGGGIITSNNDEFIDNLKLEKSNFRNFYNKELILGILKWIGLSNILWGFFQQPKNFQITLCLSRFTHGTL